MKWSMFFLVLSLLGTEALRAHAASEVIGLICDQSTSYGRDEKNILFLKQSGSKSYLRISVLDEDDLKGTLALSASDLKAIQKDTLEKLDKKIITDTESGLSATFKVDGYDYDKHPRLGIVVNFQKSKKVARFSSCVTKISAGASF